MLSTFDANFQRRKDVEQFAIDSLLRGGMRGDGKIAEAELHCQGYTGEGNPPADIVLKCRIATIKGGKKRTTFYINGRQIAAHKIALQLGSLGV